MMMKAALNSNSTQTNYAMELLNTDIVVMCNDITYHILLFIFLRVSDISLHHKVNAEAVQIPMQLGRSLYHKGALKHLFPFTVTYNSVQRVF